MKKVSRKIFGLLAASMIFAGAGAFVSCSNGSDSSSALALAMISTGSNSSNGTTAPLSDSATVSEAAAVTTSGISASVTGSVATLSASNGKYVLTGTAVQPNIAISASQAQSIGGTWKFIETGKTIAKYSGSYTGNISTIGTSNTTLTLKVERILKNGLLTAVVEVKTFDMTVPTSETFDATIPAVKVSSVITYVSAKVNVRYDSAEAYNIGSTFERIDLSDGKITSFIVGSQKSNTINRDDNSHQFSSGTYGIADGKLTFTLNNETKTYNINGNGDLTDNTGDIQFNLTNASGKLYANAVTKLDGDSSYAQVRLVWLKDDSGKTGQLMDIKRTKTTSKIINTKDVTYEISGNTVTLTGAGANTGYSNTATISGNKLTLDGDVYLKM